MELHIKNLCYAYDEKEILSNVNLVLRSGSIVSVEGKNGAGKTTLLKILAGILEIKSGEVYLDSYVIKSDSYKSRCAYIPDNPIIFDELTGEEHLELVIDLWEIKGRERNQYISRVRELAEEFKFEQYMTQKAETYSLGTKYKLFLILMLARNPSLILLDEPLTSLDFKSQDIAIDILKAKATHSIIIITSHQREIINRLAERFYCINNNNIYEQ